MTNFEATSTHEKAKKMVSHEDYMKHRVEKLKEEVLKQERKNERMEALIWLNKIEKKEVKDISDERDVQLLNFFADEKLKQIEDFKHFKQASLQPSPPPIVEKDTEFNSLLFLLNNINRNEDNATTSGKKT